MSTRENYYNNLRQALKRAQTARDNYEAEVIHGS